MGYVITSDGAEVFYKDCGPRDAQPIMFHHGWPLSSDDWDAQMLFFPAQGYRVVVHDQRCMDGLSQASHGHGMDHYATDAFAVVEAVDVKNVVHIGHSTGGRRGGTLCCPAWPARHCTRRNANPAPFPVWRT